MKSFDTFDWSSVMSEDMLLLTTVVSIDHDAPIQIADFSDMEALIFNETHHFVGYSPTRGLRLCKGPPVMKGGIWFVSEDTDAQKLWNDVKLSTDTISLSIIK